MSKEEIANRISVVRENMINAAKNTLFIEAAQWRDELVALQDMLAEKQ
jgi:excinuclease UvrABC helicase subunit UvrB